MPTQTTIPLTNDEETLFRLLRQVDLAPAAPQRAMAQAVAALASGETVRINVLDPDHETHVRALLGPSVYDRVLAVNMFGTKTVLLLSVIAFLYGRPDFLDLALAYALINFIGVLAVLEFFRSRAQHRRDELQGGR